MLFLCDLEELIGIATSNKNGLVSKSWCFPKGKYISPEDNIDNLDSGIYSVGAGNDNIPNSNTGLLFCYTGLTYDYRFQIYFNAVKNLITYRFSYGTDAVWKEWRTIQ